MVGDQLGRHPEDVGLGLVGIGDDAPGEIGRGPGRLGEPRRELAGRARLRERDPAPVAEQLGHLLVDRGAVAAEDEAAVALQDPGDQRLAGLVAPGAVAHVDLQLPAAQAGRDLERREVDVGADLAQRLGDLRFRHPEQAHRLRPVRLGARQHRLHPGGREHRLPHRVQLARRAREHDHGRPAADRHHEPGRGPGRIDRLGAHRNHRLLAVRDPQRVGVEAKPAGEVGEDRGDLVLHALVEDHLHPREAGDDLGGQVVGGRPQPAAGDDEVAALGRHEPEPALEVLGPVADREDVRDLDPELAEPLRDPGAVAIRDPRGDHLGARDQDAGAHAHSSGLNSGRARLRPAGLRLTAAASTAAGLGFVLPDSASRAPDSAPHGHSSPGGGAGRTRCGATIR